MRHIPRTSTKFQRLAALICLLGSLLIASSAAWGAAPPAPTGLDASDAGYPNRVGVSWDHVRGATMWWSSGTLTANIGGVPIEVSYAGPQDGFEGLDQVNLVLTTELAGLGRVEIVLTVDGQVANTVFVEFQ